QRPCFGDWTFGVRAPAGLSAKLLEHAERIRRRCRARTTARAFAIDPDLPGRTMAGDRLLLVFCDRILAHPGEEIVRVIILAHVLEAEAPVFALAQPALRGAMGCDRLAPAPVAHGAI